MIRFASAAAVFAIAFAVAPVAFAKDIKETKTFTKANGTKVVATTNFHTKTDVTDIKVTKTEADGKIRTVKETIAPDHKDGFNVTKTVTGFNGNVSTTHSSIGPGAGHSSTSASSGGHSGSHGKA